MPHNVALQNFRKSVMAFEAEMGKAPGCVKPEEYETKHEFADGLYMRSVIVPKGQLFVTKLHKKAHPLFILKGEISILTEEGVCRVRAPYYFITKAGTKRIIYVHEEVIGMTVHATNETDLDKIEEEVIAKDYNELEEK